MVAHSKKKLHGVVLAAVAFLMYLPFANKAFHIDGPVTVYIAEQLLVDPVNPPAGAYGPHLWPWNHTELTAKSAFRATPHPPLVSYWVALAIKIAGRSERVINWSMFPFYLGAVLFFYGLCRVLRIKYYFAVALLFAVSPVLVVNAQNAMYDVPLGMFTIATFYFLLRHKHRHDAVFAGVFAGLACLVKFTAGTAVIAGMLYFVMRKEWRNLAWFTCIAGSFNAVWLLHNIVILGNWQLTGNGHAHFLLGDLRYRCERMLAYIGGGVMLPVFPLLLWWKIKKYRKTGCVIIGATGIWSALLMYHLQYSLSSALIYWLAASAGGMMVIMAVPLVERETVVRSQGDDHAWSVLVLHVGLQMVGGLFLTLYAARYSLTFIFILLIAAAVSMQRVTSCRFQKTLWTSAIATSVLLSVLLSISDYRLVEAERQIAVDVREKYGAESRMFFKGRLGYLYYMYNADGLSLIDHKEAPARGDLLVKNCFYPKDDAEFFNSNDFQLALVDSFAYHLFPLRTIGGRAGFYGNDRLPYAWVGNPSKRVFEVYKVK